MSAKQTARALPPPPVEASDWLEEAVLEPMLEINGQCVELLCAMADSTPAPLAMLRELSPLWRSLPREARARLGHMPYLLLDAGFCDEARWQKFRHGGVQDVPRALRAGCFAGERAAGFTRRVLVYGWHLARAHASVARVVLGISPVCQARLAALSLREIDLLCEQHPGWVRPRWETRPLVWRQMLTAALNADEVALRQAGLRGIQLLAAEALAGRRQA
jgi:hypothetical protein